MKFISVGFLLFPWLNTDASSTINKENAIHELYQQKKMNVKDICTISDIIKPTLYKVIQN